MYCAKRVNCCFHDKSKTWRAKHVADFEYVLERQYFMRGNAQGSQKWPNSKYFVLWYLRFDFPQHTTTWDFFFLGLFEAHEYHFTSLQTGHYNHHHWSNYFIYPQIINVLLFDLLAFDINRILMQVMMSTTGITIPLRDMISTIRMSEY